ncbi:MAG: Chitinase [Polaromonas sp.]|nr:Chitinase [Polaromonas sp.]
MLPGCRFSPAGKALAGALVLGLGQAASAVEIAPYFHSWGGSLVDAKNQAGMNSAKLAFAVSRGGCVLDRGLQDSLSGARNYVNAGGKLLISFGGAAGIFLEIACKDDNQLFSIMEKIMNDSGTRRFDFDIEGPQLLNAEGNARRARVLDRLQNKYPDLHVSFTLPSWLRGFDANAMNILRSTAQAGVRIDRINAMTMSFGVGNIKSMVTPSTVAQASIVAFRAAASQVASLYPSKSQTQVHAMMGITPMIGKNDDGSTFTLTDARTIADFAKLNGIGLISFWSFHRDRAQAGGSNDLDAFSGVAQSNHQFHSVFKTAAGGGYVAPSPAPTPVGGTPSPACSAANWVQGRYYAAGSKVTYANAKYVADVANPGYNPVVSGYFWSRYYC